MSPGSPSLILYRLKDVADALVFVLLFRVSPLRQDASLPQLDPLHNKLFLTGYVLFGSPTVPELLLVLNMPLHQKRALGGFLSSKSVPVLAGTHGNGKIARRPASRTLAGL